MLETENQFYCFKLITLKDFGFFKKSTKFTVEGIYAVNPITRERDPKMGLQEYIVTKQYKGGGITAKHYEKK